MRAAFHFIGCADRREGAIWVRGLFGHVVDALATQLDHLDLLLDARTADHKNFEGQTDYAIQAPNVDWISLGPYVGPAAVVRRWGTIATRLPRHRPAWDFVIVREPSRRSPLVRYFTGNTPKVLVLGGDYWREVTQRSEVSLRSHLKGLYFHNSLRRAMGHALVFVNNDVLFERYQPYAREIHLTRTSTLSETHLVKEIRPRFDHEPPYRLLFVGRIGIWKGLEYFAEALAMLNAGDLSRPKFTLTVVGNSPYADYERQLKAHVESLGVSGAIDWVGYQPLEAVWEFYRQADALVLPTRVENVARVNWEAMSQGCPVITTPVGGQAQAFSDREQVLFCQPADSQDLADKIRLLSEDAALRQRLQEQGLKLAQGNTVEIRARELVDLTAHYLDAYHLRRSKG